MNLSVTEMELLGALSGVLEKLIPGHTVLL